jgi:acetyl esterase/lipase
MLLRSAARGRSWRPSTTRISRQSAVSKKTSSYARACAADIAVPKGAGPHPVVIYLHGGGWAFGSPTSHRKLGMQFAEAGYLTIVLDYRLAPEHPFPAALEDTMFAIGWAADNVRRWNGDGRRIAIGGDPRAATWRSAPLPRALLSCARWCERQCSSTVHTISRRPPSARDRCPGCKSN